jgi:hypothetical protein
MSYTAGSVIPPEPAHPRPRTINERVIALAIRMVARHECRAYQPDPAVVVALTNAPNTSTNPQ